jgi:glycosyltransferase involved in cell wall biosynthesis
MEIETKQTEDVIAKTPYSETILRGNRQRTKNDTDKKSGEVLFITSYPPNECGIATYSQDLISALNNKFNGSFSISVCALESPNSIHPYPKEVKFILDTADPDSYAQLLNIINEVPVLSVVLQHEFGFFNDPEDKDLLHFLYQVKKPVVISFHTVLPKPAELLKNRVKNIVSACEAVIVMTDNAEQLLVNEYGIPKSKVCIIPHGTHLVPHLDKEVLKNKYKLTDRKVLSTFGLISSGKSIETTLDALPAIVKQNPDVLFLIIGKTHPSIVRYEQERYRNMLEKKIEELHLQQYVKFINNYLPLPELLEYLQLTDIYLFTSKDPNQAVSGTFSYAMSCACPIISTPIPHAKEILKDDAGILIDFESPKQLSAAVNRLLNDDELRASISLNALHRIASTAWENSAVAHTLLLKKVTNSAIQLKYNLPEINLYHFKELTTDFGMIQFSKINQPDLNSGYTLDDNARALIAMCMDYALRGDKNDIDYIYKYFNFIKYCFRPNGCFLNYVNIDKKFTEQNNVSSLEDANGRAIWALGYLISKNKLMPAELITEAEEMILKILPYAEKFRSTRSMSFIIKGLYYCKGSAIFNKVSHVIESLALRLINMYKHESDNEWKWFESYLTYGNSVLPEAVLCAYLLTGDVVYEKVAKESFHFLLSITFNDNRIKLISNKGWLHKGEETAGYGEQPIDVAYTILALERFYDAFKDDHYKDKMEIAFSWFLGNNHLHHIIYNPCTGGCYDGLEKSHVNLNQGAESMVSYLMARLTVENIKE